MPTKNELLGCILDARDFVTYIHDHHDETCDSMSCIHINILGSFDKLLSKHGIDIKEK